jgi:hypothetical protein
LGLFRGLFHGTFEAQNLTPRLAGLREGGEGVGEAHTRGHAHALFSNKMKIYRISF